MPVGVIFAAWLLPGGGHFLQRRWGRGSLLLGAIGLMFFLGLAMGGRFFHIAPGNFVENLGSLGDFCSGLFYFGAKFWGYDSVSVAAPEADYGTKFLLVAGLLNVLCILDAYDIAVGNKS
ncbi:MAG: hypothetical protein HYX73_04575 [Acidobacteria bacterium]|nr:hypothetical protein [Acidobacteriota bacterium]